MKQLTNAERTAMRAEIQGLYFDRATNEIVVTQGMNNEVTLRRVPYSKRNMKQAGDETFQANCLVQSKYC